MTTRDENARQGRPTPKVVAGGLAGAVTVLLVWVADLAGLDVPSYVAAAVLTVVSFAASYLTPGR